MIEPYAKHVLVIPDDMTNEVRTPAGIIIPADARKREDMTVILRWGELKAVGEDCEPLQPGMRVAYNPFDGDEVTEDGATYDIVPIAGVRAFTAPS